MLAGLFPNSEKNARKKKSLTVMEESSQKSLNTKKVIDEVEQPEDEPRGTGSRCIMR